MNSDAPTTCPPLRGNGAWSAITAVSASRSRLFLSVVPISRFFSASSPACVAEVSPHLSIVELVANDLGDRHSKDDHQRDGDRAAHCNRYCIPLLIWHAT